MFQGQGRQSESCAAVAQRPYAWLGALCLSFAACNALAGDYSFTRIDSGNFDCFPTGVSGDGSVVVGFLQGFPTRDIFRWTHASGLERLGHMPGGFFDYVTDVSADGSVIVGYSYVGSHETPFRWTSQTGIVGLDNFPDTPKWAQANAISADGSVIVGTIRDADGKNSEAFRWTKDGGMVGIGQLGIDSDFGAVSGISADGSVVIAYATYNGHPGSAFRWTSSDGMVALESPNGFQYASAISADGSVIVGRMYDANFNTVPFRLTRDGGLMPITWNFELGEFNPGGVSGNGSFILAGAGDAYDALLWTPESGAVNLRKLLAAHGVLNVGDDTMHWILEAPGAISDDGRTIVGWGSAPGLPGSSGWVATIPEPSTLILMGIGFFMLAVCRGRARR